MRDASLRSYSTCTSSNGWHTGTVAVRVRQQSSAWYELYVEVTASNVIFHRGRLNYCGTNYKRVPLLRGRTLARVTSLMGYDGPWRRNNVRPQ